jgi:hypothetical protein
MSAPLPDDALVVRGGLNLQDSFRRGKGVVAAQDGTLRGVSVNCAPGLTLADLTSANAHTGYPGIPHSQVGVTTVGSIRKAGGEVIATPTRRNPNHGTINGLTAKELSSLFQPTQPNPSKPKAKP